MHFLREFALEVTVIVVPNFGLVRCRFILRLSVSPQCLGYIVEEVISNLCHLKAAVVQFESHSSSV